MRKLLFLFITLVVLQSCVENVTTFPEDAGVYYGDLTVGEYTEYVGVSVKENDNSTVEIFFDNVKFAKGMPLRVDITVKEVPCYNNGDVLGFSAKDIEPYMNREEEPQPNYRFSMIEGTVDGNRLVLKAKMAEDLKGSPAGKEFYFTGVCKE